MLWLDMCAKVQFASTKLQMKCVFDIFVISTTSCNDRRDDDNDDNQNKIILLLNCVYYNQSPCKFAQKSSCYSH